MKTISPRPFQLWMTLAGATVMLCIILICSGLWMQYRAMTAGVSGILRLTDEYYQPASATLSRISEAGAHDCETILPLLTSLATLTPYTRSAGIISGKTIICSSFSGNKSWPVKSIFPDVSVSDGNMPAVASSISMNPGHGDSVIVYTRMLKENIYAYTVLDTRYMRELIKVMAGNTHLNYALQAGHGRSVTLGGPRGDHEVLTSLQIQAGDIRVSAYSTLRSWLYFSTEGIPIILPAFLLFSFLSGTFWKRWHAARISPASVISRAITEGEFFVCYQPVCDISGHCHGAEALMRWRRNNGRLIPPDVFIPAAESEKMMGPLTRHLMRLIANDVKEWIPTGEFHLSINIASEHLAGGEFIGDMRAFRDSIPSSLSLVAEITERTLIENTEKTVTHLSQLREAGIKVAIDDFGTGYCSLSILQILPADFLKIDRCFTETIDSANGDTPVLDAIITLSKRLKLTMIAEGISTRKQALFMSNNQVMLLQGYLFSQPLDAANFRKWYLRNVYYMNTTSKV
ncbi:EAL domain-containing protein [Enterobacter sp. TMH.L2]